MSAEEKAVERKILIKRAFPKTKLFEIGRKLAIPYFEHLDSPWTLDEERAAYEIASAVNDAQLKEIFDAYKSRSWVIFMGRHYTFEDGLLFLKGAWDKLQASIRELRKKYGASLDKVLRVLLEAGGGCSRMEVAEKLKDQVDPAPILADLERMKIIAPYYEGKEYKEWIVSEEVAPLLRLELGLSKPEAAKPLLEAAGAPSRAEGKVDYVALERLEIERMDNELSTYLNDLLKKRLDATIRLGKTLSLSALADYLIKLFGPVLYFDSLLSIVQQYGLADVEIVHERGKAGMRTGWNLALFGDPGTGKSFATRDMILGKPDAKIPAHGIPGRNRYAAGMTPARFIRIGQAYEGRVFNFIITEFNDWFKYKGMVEPLKLAMERGVIKYELHREVIGPYRFSSFFSVNYNVATYSKGYETTISDPNFSLPYDEVVLIYGPNGYEFVKIGELVESQPRNVKVVSFDPETLRVELCEVTGYIKHPPSRIYEVRLRSGRRVKVTAGHSLFTISQGGEIRATSAINLRPGDYVAIPKRLPPAPEPVTKLNVARLLLKAGLSANISVKFKDAQKCLAWFSSPRAFSEQANKPYTTICCRKKISMMPLEVYAKLDPELSSLPSDATLKLPNGEAFPINVDLNEDFAWFLGFYLAKGDVHRNRYVRLKIKNEAYASRVKAVAEKLGIKADYNGKVVVLNSAMLVRLLTSLGIGRKSHEKRIPFIMFNLPPNCIKSFTDGYFAGNGHLDVEGGEIVAGTACEHLPSDVMYLMLTLNKLVRTTCTKKAKYIVIPKEDMSFVNVPSIAFKQVIKDLQAKTQLSQRTYSTIDKGSVSRSRLAETETDCQNGVKWHVPVSLLESPSKDVGESQEAGLVEKLVNGDLAWDEVLEVVDLGREEPTYDLEVRPGGREIENFLGGYGGIFLHNSAIEDRMLCRLHRLTKERFVELARSQRRMALGEIDVDRGAQRIRDHLTLVYAIESEHPLVKGRFSKKPVLITPEAFEAIERARNAILKFIPDGSVGFSARLENMVLRFACSASLIGYFGSGLDYIPLSGDALKYAIRLYVEEASIRSKGAFEPEEVLEKLKL